MHDSLLFSRRRLSLFFDQALGSLLLTQHAEALENATCGQVIAPLGWQCFDPWGRCGRNREGGKHDNNGAGSHVEE